MKRNIHLGWVLAMTTLSAPAFAEDSSLPPPASGGGGYESEISPSGSADNAGSLPTFSQIDRDSSGAVDQTEAQRVSGLDWTTADRDGDGQLSPSEFESAMRKSSGSGSSSGGSEATGGSGASSPSTAP